MVDEDECGIVDGCVEMSVEGPATAFVCSPFMASDENTRVDSG